MPNVHGVAVSLCAGGNRAFYQQGVLEVWGPLLWPHLRSVIAVSGGAAVGVVMFSGRAPETMEHWNRLRRDVHRNVYPERVWRGKPCLPHAEIYRSALACALADGGLERIRALPFALRVVCTRMPRSLPPAVSVPLGTALLCLPERLRPVRLKLAAALGMSGVAFDLRGCASHEEAVDLVMASSAVFPVIDAPVLHGSRLADGTILDGAPRHDPRWGSGLTSLVIHTRTDASREPARASDWDFHQVPSEQPPSAPSTTGARPM